MLIEYKENLKLFVKCLKIKYCFMLFIKKIRVCVCLLSIFINLFFVEKLF